MSEDAPETGPGDPERDRAARLLQDHFAQGRLGGGEFSSRLERVYKAASLRDLEAAVADLPSSPAPPEPADRPAPPVPGGPGMLRDPALLIPWGLWLGVNTLCFTIWLILFLTGQGDGYPWFLWVLGPWGIVMVFITLGLAAVHRGGGGAARG
ncbi:DUF1707 domain-containing protein [Nocardiopsis sp. RSe5-2]|uniref:DUF1707 domain-containing protein n=1 Tax=Nocardiopsis endophytica TaxID=3018445 RepID=A0ABT4UB53_9ACTN|nr:DUF1707 domain-containing protein [Nocardiopsis endophytica]MDA2814202.1 DUF1707 domain-containing protein [Nocardiopsis endophytica]